MPRKSLLVILLMFLECSKPSASEIVAGNIPGSIVLREGSHEVVYKGVVGHRDGFHRALTQINGSPALSVSAKYDFYYTLLPKKGRVVIDCAYFDVRNIYNGARATAGICGLDSELSENYDEIAQYHLNQWRSSIFHFDTISILEDKLGKDFLIGKIGGVEVFDRYPTPGSLMNSSPQKIIRGPAGCFNFESTTGYLVFVNRDQPMLRYLDLLKSTEPMVFQRMQETDLQKIAVEKCT
jgi:hypothetical protein